MATGLQTIREEDLHDPQLEGVTDPEQVKTLRTNAKRTHTKTCKLIEESIARNALGDLEAHRSRLVNIFETIEMRHQ